MPRAGWKKPETERRLSDLVSVGVLTRVFSPELVDEVIESAGRTQRRHRSLPARVMAYFAIAMGLYSEGSYEDVLADHRKLRRSRRMSHWFCSTATACNTGMQAETIWRVSRLGAAYPLPEIYSTTGSNAAQWRYLSKYSYVNHGSKFTFPGVMSQAGACYVAICTGVDNAPASS